MVRLRLLEEGTGRQRIRWYPMDASRSNVMLWYSYRCSSSVTNPLAMPAVMFSAKVGFMLVR